jgi:acylglycerol lipase
MTSTEETVTGADGLDLFRCAWPSAEPCRAAAVLLHGYGEHCARYGALVGALNRAGISVFSYDHRGHGRSAGRRAYVSAFAGLVPDAVSAIRWARSSCPDVPVYLLGHSMGGALAALVGIEHGGMVDGLVLSAPAVKISDDVSPFLQKIAGLLGALAPRLPAAELDASLVSRDPAVVAAYEADPLVYHGKILARTGHQLLSTETSVLGRAAELTLPFLVLHGSEDGLADPRGSAELHAGAASSDKTHIVLDGLYHEILNEPEQAEVRQHILDWLDQRLSARG